MKGRSPSSSIPRKHSNRRARAGNRTEDWNVTRIVAELKRAGEQRNIEGMARFGIRAKRVLGVAKPKIDGLAAKIGRNHAVALQLWQTGIHDARILAGMVAEREEVTAALMDRWVKQFDNWDICDGTCCHLLVFAKPAWSRAFAWSGRNKEFEKRAGFALAAFLAVHDKTAPNSVFQKYLVVIEREAWDDRNFVRKAVNWALRNIGKRNRQLNRAAIRVAERLRRQESRAARWIATDALRELRSEAVARRLREKSKDR
jgi:3-methyladenine DNA glycosylase AlkD